LQDGERSRAFGETSLPGSSRCVPSSSSSSLPANTASRHSCCYFRMSVCGLKHLVYVALRGDLCWWQEQEQAGASSHHCHCLPISLHICIHTDTDTDTDTGTGTGAGTDTGSLVGGWRSVVRGSAGRGRECFEHLGCLSRLSISAVIHVWLEQVRPPPYSPPNACCCWPPCVASPCVRALGALGASTAWGERWRRREAGEEVLSTPLPLPLPLFLPPAPRDCTAHVSVSICTSKVSKLTNKASKEVPLFLPPGDC